MAGRVNKTPYLFPASLSVAKAFKLLNEDPGGSEKILLWLRSN